METNDINMPIPMKTRWLFPTVRPTRLECRSYDRKVPSGDWFTRLSGRASEGREGQDQPPRSKSAGFGGRYGLRDSGASGPHRPSRRHGYRLKVVPNAEFMQAHTEERSESQTSTRRHDQAGIAPFHALRHALTGRCDQTAWPRVACRAPTGATETI